jgi:hypothetical protein
VAVRTNGYYADPALDESFNNLAKAFATPSGSDVYGYTNAAATKEKAARLADYYNYMKSPGYDQAQGDRMGVGSGSYAPNASYYSVDQNNATTRRDADVVAATGRDVANINNAGELARTFAKPIILSEGQTAYNPAQTVAATGLAPTLSGAFKTDPGQTITKPDGSVISGTAKPMTSDELKAKVLGTLPPEEQRAVAMAPADVAPVVGKDGEPVNVFKADSVGRAPYTADTLQPQNGNYKTADGKIGTATFSKDTKKWVDTPISQKIQASTLERGWLPRFDSAFLQAH